MRFLKTLLPLVAAATMLTSCSGTDGSSPAPLGRTAAQVGTKSQELGGLRPVLVALDARPMASCSSAYTECFQISKGDPYTAEWCISDSGNCSSGLAGTPDWTATVTNPKTGKPEKGLTAVWSPDPGNPSTLTITNHRKHCKNPNEVKWVVTLSECDGSLGCNYDFVVFGVEC